MLSDASTCEHDFEELLLARSDGSWESLRSKGMPLSTKCAWERDVILYHITLSPSHLPQLHV